MMCAEIARTIHAMEVKCFGKPWSFKVVSAAVENPFTILVVRDYGYALGQDVSGESELHRIAVLPEFRGQGKAYSLMQGFFEECRNKCNNAVFLEVASRNIAAIKLYQKCGFAEIARRKNYYENDDAIIMRKEFT
jgi:ribosomal-protein-alanine N-acetyltransferase